MVVNTGVKYPGTAGQTTIAPWDDWDWQNINNALTDDTTYATITNDGYDIGTYTYIAKFSNFGFSVPAGNLIVGILVEIGAGADASEYSKFDLVQLSKNNTDRVGSNLSSGAELTAAIVNYSFGGSANLWGTTWTPAEINSTNFAVFVAFTPTYNNSDIYLDYVRVTVYYAPEEKASSDGDMKLLLTLDI